MQCDMTSLGRPCIAPGNDLHTCTVCTLSFHHLCAGEDSGWDKCPECVSGSGAAPVQHAGPSSGAALAVVGDGQAAPAAAVSGGQRCAPAPAAVNTWQGFWAAKVAAPPARPRAVNKQVPAKAPSPAAARAAAAEGPEAVVSFLASVPVEQHATARERIVPINDGGARKRKSGASGGASGVDDEGVGSSAGPADLSQRPGERAARVPCRDAVRAPGKRPFCAGEERRRVGVVGCTRCRSPHLGGACTSRVFRIANKRCRRARIQHSAQHLRCRPEAGSGRLRGDFPHAPVQQPAWLWPPATLVRRGRHSTAGWRRAAAEKTGRKRRI